MFHELLTAGGILALMFYYSRGVAPSSNPAPPDTPPQHPQQSIATQVSSGMLFTTHSNETTPQTPGYSRAMVGHKVLGQGIVRGLVR